MYWLRNERKFNFFMLLKDIRFGFKKFFLFKTIKARWTVTGMETRTEAILFRIRIELNVWFFLSKCLVYYLFIVFVAITKGLVFRKWWRTSKNVLCSSWFWCCNIINIGTKLVHLFNVVLAIKLVSVAELQLMIH